MKKELLVVLDEGLSLPENGGDGHATEGLVASWQIKDCRA